MDQDGRLIPNVLVLAEHNAAATALDAMLLGSAGIRHAPTCSETEGRGVDVVVVATLHPVDEVRQVRAHPVLCGLPAVVLDASGRLDAAYLGPNTWLIDMSGPDAFDDLAERVAWLLARARHPSSPSSVWRSSAA